MNQTSEPERTYRPDKTSSIVGPIIGIALASLCIGVGASLITKAFLHGEGMVMGALIISAFPSFGAGAWLIYLLVTEDQIEELGVNGEGLVGLYAVTDGRRKLKRSIQIGGNGQYKVGFTYHRKSSPDMGSPFKAVLIDPLDPAQPVPFECFSAETYPEARRHAIAIANLLGLEILDVVTCRYQTYTATQAEKPLLERLDTIPRSEWRTTPSSRIRSERTSSGVRIDIAPLDGRLIAQALLVVGIGVVALLGGCGLVFSVLDEDWSRSEIYPIAAVVVIFLIVASFAVFDAFCAKTRIEIDRDQLTLDVDRLGFVAHTTIPLSDLYELGVSADRLSLFIASSDRLHKIESGLNFDDLEAIREIILDHLLPRSDEDTASKSEPDGVLLGSW
jgi:hypothetical protein